MSDEFKFRHSEHSDYYVVPPEVSITLWASIKHGTNAGYKKHGRMKIPTIDECGCREAHNAHMREYSASGQPGVENDKARQRAMQRARTRVVNLHPTDLEAFYQEELRVEGL